MGSRRRSWGGGGGGGVFTDFKGRVEKAIPGVDDNFKGWGRENDPREGKQ